MAGQDAAAQGPTAGPVDPTAQRRGAAAVAYRRAWLSLALYPVSIVAAFVIGEGLISALSDDAEDPAFWQVLAAATPAMLVLVVPGILAVAQGRRAMTLGRSDGRVPAVVGATIGLGFIGLNLLQSVVGLVTG
jgi:hypothetical protein